MILRWNLFIFILIICRVISGQVSITSPAFSYTETFGSAGPSSWSNNSSYLGWYYTSSNNNYGGYINITAAGPSNTGGLYTYQCSGGGNVKLGSRASSGTGTIRYGLRLVNNTGFAIQSISVSFDFYQLSLAENGSTANTVGFSYLQAATANNLNAGGFVNVASLDFNSIQSSSTCGGSQLNGYPCNQGGTKVSTCIIVTIPIGEEILLRWSDDDNSCNDHHMAIDNVDVKFFSNNSVNPNTTCNPLPIELLDFSASRSNESVMLNWSTASETNNRLFSIERSEDAIEFETIGTIGGAGNSYKKLNYSFEDDKPLIGTSYYRLKQTDINGTYRYSHTIAYNSNKENIFQIFPNPSQNGPITVIHDFDKRPGNLIRILDYSGKVIYEYEPLSAKSELDLSQFHKGVYILQYFFRGQWIHKKLVLN